MELVVCRSVNVVALTSKIVISVKSDNQKLTASSRFHGMALMLKLYLCRYDPMEVEDSDRRQALLLGPFSHFFSRQKFGPEW